MVIGILLGWMGFKGMFVGMIIVIIFVKLFVVVVKKGWILKMLDGVFLIVLKLFVVLILSVIVMVVFFLVKIVFEVILYGSIYEFIFKFL